MRRDDICLYLGPAERSGLQAQITNRNTPRKLVWRAEIVLATADCQGTLGIMRRTGISKPTVWRWQELISMKGWQVSSATRHDPRAYRRCLWKQD